MLDLDLDLDLDLELDLEPVPVLERWRELPQLEEQSPGRSRLERLPALPSFPSFYAPGPVVRQL